MKKWPVRSKDSLKAGLEIFLWKISVKWLRCWDSTPPWWKEKMSRFYVLSEISKLAYYQVVHGLLRIDREPPWVVAFKHRYEQWLLASMDRF